VTRHTRPGAVAPGRGVFPKVVGTLRVPSPFPAPANPRYAGTSLRGGGDGTRSVPTTLPSRPRGSSTVTTRRRPRGPPSRAAAGGVRLTGRVRRATCSRRPGVNRAVFWCAGVVLAAGLLAAGGALTAQPPIEKKPAEPTIDE